MGLLLFFLLLVVAAIAAGVHTWITGLAFVPFIGRFVAYALLLTLPAILPKLIGG